jgi:hypothetical protein
MEIQACIRCGSRNIRRGGIQDGAIPGYTDLLDKFVCDDCNHMGLPIIFDKEEEYNEFVKALKEDKKRRK